VNDTRLMRAADAWLRLMLRLYPADFREEMGAGFLETYRDRARAAEARGGAGALLALCARALVDSVRNGLGERLRPAIAWRRSGNWGRDSQFVLRRLRRSPLFVLSTVAALTIGFGAFTIVYTVVHKVLIEPLPYDDPDELYSVWRNYTWMQLDRGWLGGPDIAQMQAAGGPIESAVGLRREPRTLVVPSGGEPEEVAVMLTSPNLFDVLGVRPVLGRGFLPEEVGPARRPVAVLTHQLWTRRFNADSRVIGSDIRLNGEAFVVVGVLGPEFRFAMPSALGQPRTAEVYITFPLNFAEQSPFAGSFAALVRARHGASAESLASAVGAVGLAIDERHIDKRGLRLYPLAMQPDLVGRVKPALLVLGVSGLALVIVLMINLATLLLERSSRRAREFAISRALGADEGAIARAMVFEGGLLGLLGGASGALLGYWGIRALAALAPLDLPRREAIIVDAPIAAFIVGLGLVLGAIAGALPAIWTARGSLPTLLGSVAVRGGGGGNSRVRRGLVVAQVALSLVLLTTGGVVARSLDGLLRADAGFDPAGVLTFRIPVPAQRYPDEAAGMALLARVEAEFSRLPGVTHVGASDALPLSAAANQRQVAFPGAPGNRGNTDADAPLVDQIAVYPGYVEAMKIDVLTGRAFARTAPAGTAEAMIDRTLAERFFPTGNPIGATVQFGSTTRFTIIGVVDHARLYGVHEDGRSQVYIRAQQPTLSWALRTSRDPESLLPDVRAALRRIDPELPLADPQSMDAVVGDSIRQQRLSATLVAGFSVAALLLATMGLFGVVSAAVTRRRHEIAVRLALGAEHSQVTRMVVGEGALLVLAGLAAGVPGVYFAGQLASGMLVGVSPFDAPTLAAVTGMLVVVTLVACYLPARRVSGIEPAGLLRRGD
jgi:putative ABC transport system permease protein